MERGRHGVKPGSGYALSYIVTTGLDQPRSLAADTGIRAVYTSAVVRLLLHNAAGR